MSLLSSFQRASVLASSRHLDHLLADAVRILGEAGQDSPFAEYVADATPVQVRVIEDSVARFRRAVLTALDG